MGAFNTGNNSVGSVFSVVENRMAERLTTEETEGTEMGAFNNGNNSVGSVFSVVENRMAERLTTEETERTERRGDG